MVRHTMAEHRGSTWKRLTSKGSRIAVGLVQVFLSLPLWAQSTTADTADDSSGNPLLRWLWVLLGLLAIWFFCYKGLYPWLRKYYDDVSSKAIFWPTLLLYAVTWIHVSAYWIFDYGFYWFWLRVTCLFLAFVFSLWFLVSFSRRRVY